MAGRIGTGLDGFVKNVCVGYKNEVGCCGMEVSSVNTGELGCVIASEVLIVCLF